MHLFYAPQLLASAVLPEVESQHAVKVLRLNCGDSIQLVDGKGGLYNARITLPHHKHCGFEITETLTDTSLRNYQLHLAIAPTKNIDRFEWFVEKATEIGIDQITPLICKNSERKTVKAERIEKIIISAAKQSLKAKFPELNSACAFEEFISTYHADHHFIAHCHNDDKWLLKSQVQAGKSVIILIGPEGDFSTQEVTTALKNNYLPVSLGNSRLRTETAGLVACSTVAFCNL